MGMVYVIEPTVGFFSRMFEAVKQGAYVTVAASGEERTEDPETWDTISFTSDKSLATTLATPARVVPKAMVQHLDLIGKDPTRPLMVPAAVLRDYMEAPSRGTLTPNNLGNVFTVGDRKFARLPIAPQTVG